MKKYVLAVSAGVLLVCLVLFAQDYADAQGLQCVRILCDAFTVPALVLLLTGMLSWVAGEGLFDGLSYAVRSLAGMFARWEHLRYRDYVKSKREARTPGGCGFLLVTGAAFAVPALVFLLLFYTGEALFL